MVLEVPYILIIYNWEKGSVMSLLDLKVLMRNYLKLEMGLIISTPKESSIIAFGGFKLLWGI